MPTLLYWAIGNTASEISNFWFFERNGQGDSWLFDRAGQVYFYDHDQSELARFFFIVLGLTFGQWLQFAGPNKQLDEMYEGKAQLSEATKADYRHCLARLSFRLLTNHPFAL